MTGYGYKHQKARAELLADRPPCVWCRDAIATEADHVPPLAAFAPGEWVGQYVPSCGPCNARRGGTFARQRAQRRPINSRRW